MWPDQLGCTLSTSCRGIPAMPLSTRLGVGAEDAAELAVHVGNLTLLSGTRNMSISNRPFSQKRSAFEDSDLAMNRSVADAAAWDADAIARRGTELAQLAVRAWPWPGKGVAAAPGPGDTATAPSLPDPLAPITGSPELMGSVWVPRILWALGCLRVTEGEAAQANATRIAQLYSANHPTKVAGSNAGRAFRKHRRAMIEAGYVAERSPKEYAIAGAGIVALLELCAKDDS